MAEYKDIARSLMHSGILNTPPIVVHVRQQPDNTIIAETTPAAAGCVFWERARTRTFATGAEHHSNCSVGVHTHNLVDVEDSHSSDLNDTLAAMRGLKYVTDAEVGKIPVVQSPSRQVVYGPLSECTSAPDVVLMFCDAAQGLVIAEAVDRVDGNAPRTMGRPACAVVPAVMNQGEAVVSLGCCGARTYMESLTNDQSVWGFPGSKIQEYAAEILVFHNANKVLHSFHTTRASDVSLSKVRSVSETLELIS